jgi:hypothetical protein
MIVIVPTTNGAPSKGSFLMVLTRVSVVYLFKKIKIKIKKKNKIKKKK